MGSAEETQALLQAAYDRRGARRAQLESTGLHLSKVIPRKSLREQMMRGQGIGFMESEPSMETQTVTGSKRSRSKSQHETKSAASKRSATASKKTEAVPVSAEPPSTINSNNINVMFDPSRDIVRQERQRESSTTQDIRIIRGTSETWSEQFFVDAEALQSQLAGIAKVNGVSKVDDDASNMILFALQEYIRDALEQLVDISKRRMDVLKEAAPIRIANDPGLVLKQIFREHQVRQIQAKEEERRRLEAEMEEFKGADLDQLDEETRARAEALLKVQDREMQQQVFSSSNDAALAAIGASSFRKRTNKPATERQQSSAASILPPSKIQTRQDHYMSRRICLLDVIFLFERDVRIRRSPLMYLTYYRLAQ